MDILNILRTVEWTTTLIATTGIIGDVLNLTPNQKLILLVVGAVSGLAPFFFQLQHSNYTIQIL